MVEWALNPEAIFTLVDDKLMIRGRQDKILGISDRVPRYTKNTRFSSKVHSIEQDTDEEEDPAQIAVTKREAVKKQPNPVQKQVVQGPVPNPVPPVSPIAAQSLPFPQVQPQPSAQRPACYHCGVPGHFMRECPQLVCNYSGKENMNKGGQDKGAKGKGSFQKGKGKGKGPSTFAQSSANPSPVPPNISTPTVAPTSTQTSV